MILSEILYRKNYFKKGPDEEIVDLTKASFRNILDPSILTFVIVTEDFKMRPDLIAQSVYGNQDKFDFILKYNGVSNPFSVEEGDVLIIPISDDMQNLLINPRRDEYDYGQVQKKISVKPKTEKDTTRLEILKKKADNARKRLLASKTGGDPENPQNDAVLPPNVNKPLDQNVKFKDGKIIFGEDVTTASKANCPETLSRARVKQKLLNNKIFD